MTIILFLKWHVRRRPNHLRHNLIKTSFGCPSIWGQSVRYGVLNGIRLGKLYLKNSSRTKQMTNDIHTSSSIFLLLSILILLPPLPLRWIIIGRPKYRRHIYQALQSTVPDVRPYFHGCKILPPKIESSTCCCSCASFSICRTELDTAIKRSEQLR